MTYEILVEIVAITIPDRYVYSLGDSVKCLSHLICEYHDSSRFSFLSGVMHHARRRKALIVLSLLLSPLGLVRAEPDIHDTRLLSQPAVGAKNIAFVYADDLWVADLDGKNPRRLTSDIGVESQPGASRPTARPSPSAPSTTATSTFTRSRSKAARRRG